ncbi:hypothetical protein TNCV_1476931 [Trichonephila clavipes]|nr:hypothetical protein TNCV_1476931 [Trichonephila clavipes]
MRLVERKGTIDGFEWRCRVQSKENPHFVCRSWTNSWTTGNRSKCHHSSCCNGCIKESHLTIKEGGNALQKQPRGHGRNTTPLEGHNVALVAKRNRNFTPGQIAAYVATTIDTHISARTISW